MNELMKKISGPVMALSPARRWIVGGVVVISVAAFALLISLANRTDYRPLFARLNSDDAGEIVKKLKEQKVPYRIAADGTAILVPSDKVYDLRLSLASEGLPQGGGVGFEIFDRKNFGMTEFVQKLNYQRALQGELTRTIRQIAGVDQARVHLALPEKSLFKENEKKPTASVVLQLKSGKTLRESEVQGIVHLVASSVEGMDPEQVTVLDSRGKILSRSGPADSTGKLTATMMETQRSFERNLEERLQSLLDKAVGPGKSVVRVTAALDFKQVEKMEERYDPESAVVRSEQRMEQKDGTTVAASGVPGVPSNMAKANAGPATSGGGSKNDETMNYEISRTSARIVEPVGTVSKLSMAVLVDGRMEAPAAEQGKEAPRAKYVPRTPDELQKIEALVKSAAGFNAGRGDQVSVVNVPFQETGEDAVGETPRWWENPSLMAWGKEFLLGFVFLALLLLVVRPLLKMAAPLAQRRSTEKLVREEEEHAQLEGGKTPHLDIRTVNQLELIESVRQDPYQAAQILQNWLRETP